MMRKFTCLSDKINKKGFNFDPKRRTKFTTIVEKKVTSVQIAPRRTKEIRTTRASITMIQVMMKKKKGRTETRSLGRRRAMTKRPSFSQRKKGTPREASWWKNKNG